MRSATDPAAPPSRELLLLEVRAIWELSAFFATYPLLRMAPRGDGHPVLVLPGLLLGARHTLPLRLFLAGRGWPAYDWGAGLLKWGGDALLLFFDGPEHEKRACRAASSSPRPSGATDTRSTRQSRPSACADATQCVAQAPLAGCRP